MRRVVVGVSVLVALLLGAGAYAFGSDGAPPGDRTATTYWTGADEPPGTAPMEEETPPTEPQASPSAAASSAAAPVTSTPPTGSATTGSAKPATTAKAAPAKCAQGEKQREVEVALAALGTYGPVTVDGVQSEADCAAITKFQQRFGISPANGRAGPTTGDVARRIAASRTSEERAKCRSGGGLTACVDLTLQTVWVARGGEVVFGPTVTRTGFNGYATPTGTYSIRFRNIREWSDPYKVWMPYWQNFVGGIGFHETTTYLHTGGIGSHGCVNLLHSDARDLWGLLSNGTTVQVFGRRAGT